MEYTIKLENVITSDIVDENGNVIQKGINKKKYNIYYSDLDQPEFYAENLQNPQVQIKNGYIKSEHSL